MSLMAWLTFLCLGLYHLRILLPHNYPMAAPDIILLTPNGRFELGKKVSSSQLIIEQVSDEMIDLYRWIDQLSCGLMATCMGCENR